MVWRGTIPAMTFSSAIVWLQTFQPSKKSQLQCHASSSRLTTWSALAPGETHGKVVNLHAMTLLRVDFRLLDFSDETRLHLRLQQSQVRRQLELAPPAVSEPENLVHGSQKVAPPGAGLSMNERGQLRGLLVR